MADHFHIWFWRSRAQFLWIKVQAKAQGARSLWRDREIFGHFITTGEGAAKAQWWKGLDEVEYIISRYGRGLQQFWPIKSTLLIPFKSSTLPTVTNWHFGEVSRDRLFQKKNKKKTVLLCRNCSRCSIYSTLTINLQHLKYVYTAQRSSASRFTMFIIILI